MKSPRGQEGGAAVWVPFKPLTQLSHMKETKVGRDLKNDTQHFQRDTRHQRTDAASLSSLMPERLRTTFTPPLSEAALFFPR